jgi:hypothetical protein
MLRCCLCFAMRSGSEHVGCTRTVEEAPERLPVMADLSDATVIQAYCLDKWGLPSRAAPDHSLFFVLLDGLTVGPLANTVISSQFVLSLIYFLSLSRLLRLQPTLASNYSFEYRFLPYVANQRTGIRKSSSFLPLRLVAPPNGNHASKVWVLAPSPRLPFWNQKNYTSPVLSLFLLLLTLCETPDSPSYQATLSLSFVPADPESHLHFIH